MNTRKRMEQAMEDTFKGMDRVFNEDEAEWLIEAALDAMREPSDGMILWLVRGSGSPKEAENRIKVYRAIFDAIKEGK